MGGFALVYVCRGYGGIDRWEWMMDSSLRVSDVLAVLVYVLDGVEILLFVVVGAVSVEMESCVQL